MKTRSFNYLRAYRQRWSLSSRDLAKLVLTDGSVVARLEKSQRPPAGRMALALEVVFGVPARSIFPGAYEQVEEAVMARAARMHDALANRPDKLSERKCELMEDMMRRATEHGIHV